MKRASLGWTAALAVLALRSTLAAAEPLPNEIALARRLFGEAKAAEQAKDWSAAAAKLREAIAIKETPGLRFHLAYCEEQQGQLVEALVDYDRSEDQFIERNEELKTQIPVRRSALQKRIPTVTLMLTRDPGSVQFTIDGHSMSSATLGKPIPLNPGQHAFAVSSSGAVPFTTTLTLKEGDAVVTNVILAPEPNAAPLSAAPQPRPEGASSTASPVANRPSHARTYFLVGEAAVTLGAAALGLGFMLKAKSDDDRVAEQRSAFPGVTEMERETACKPPATADPEACARIAAAANDAHDDRVVATVAFIGAGLGAATFVATLVLWPSASHQASIVPWVGR